MAKKKVSRKVRKKSSRPARAARRPKKAPTKPRKVKKKQLIKTVAKRKPIRKLKRKARRRRATRRRRPREIVSATMGFEDLITRVSEEKIKEGETPKSLFTTPSAPPTTLQDKTESDRLLMLVIDPRFAFTYWEINPDSLLEATDKIGPDAKLTLRLYDTTSAEPDVTYGDVEIFDRMGNWYLKMEHRQQRLFLEIGMKAATGEFACIARSRVMRITQEMLARPGPIKWIASTPGDDLAAPESEEYEDANHETLKKILGPYFYELLVRGRLASITGSSMEAVFHDIQTLRKGTPL